MDPNCLNIVNKEQEVQLYKIEFYIIANKYTTSSSAIVSSIPHPDCDINSKQCTVNGEQWKVNS